MTTSAKIMVAYYKDEQLPNCHVWSDEMFEPWDVKFNLGSPLLEFDLLKTMRSNGIMDQYQYSGLMSHSAYGKLAMSPEYVKAEIEDGIKNDVDAILLNPAIACNAFFKNGIEQAQLIGQDKISLIFDKLGFQNIENINLPYYTFVMCSYIIAKKSFWDKYFEIVSQIIESAESMSAHDLEFSEAYFGHANYRVRVNNYDYRPFVIERIPQIIFATNNFKIKYVESTKEVFARKFGYRAKAIYSLYELKKQSDDSNEAYAMWEKIRKPFTVNKANLYKAVTVGEFGRTRKQEEENLQYYDSGELLSTPKMKVSA